jgi:hypothetical protein
LDEEFQKYKVKQYDFTKSNVKTDVKIAGMKSGFQEG